MGSDGRDQIDCVRARTHVARDGIGTVPLVKGVLLTKSCDTDLLPVIKNRLCCQCRCGCRRKPGRRELCFVCEHMVGPCCLALDDDCKVCHVCGDNDRITRDGVNDKTRTFSHRHRCDNRRHTTCSILPSTFCSRGLILGMAKRTEDYIGRMVQVAKACMRARGPLRFAVSFIFRWRTVMFIRWSRRARSSTSSLS